jgi:hypothetical protein
MAVNTGSALGTKSLSDIQCCGRAPENQFILRKKRVDNRRLFAKFPPTMKSETLNGIFTFILGVLVVAGVILALRLVSLTKETRQLQTMEVVDTTVMTRAQSLFADAKAYNQQHPTPELTKILESVQTKAPTR